MDGAQAEWTLEAVKRLDPKWEPRWREFYNWEIGGKPNQSPPGAFNSRIGLTLRELCERHGLLDRMPRYIAPGPLALNKRIAERLFLRTYDLELEGSSSSRIWAYRRAAWTVDEHPENIGSLYHAHGEDGLRELPTIGVRLAGLIASWIREFEGIPDKTL
jgi:hypothetical protein